MAEPQLLIGNCHKDERGRINFINQFAMKEIIRFYEIAPSNTDYIRGWVGHKFEKKWFYCTSGSIHVNVVKIDDFERPSKDSSLLEYTLEYSENPTVLYVPGGYATGMKAKQDNSRLLVFSNFDIETSRGDDYRYPLEQWQANWQL